LESNGFHNINGLWLFWRPVGEIEITSYKQHLGPGGVTVL